MKAAVYGRTSRQNQYGERRMGGLPIGGQRGVHKKERLRQPCPSQKAEGARPARSGAPTTPNRKSAPRASMSSRAKGRMDLFIRTIGSARATVKIGLANLVYNLDCCS